LELHAAPNFWLEDRDIFRAQNEGNGFFQNVTTWFHTPEDSSLHNHCCEKLTSFKKCSACIVIPGSLQDELHEDCLFEVSHDEFYTGQQYLFYMMAV
jgi:hypothetical protein